MSLTPSERNLADAYEKCPGNPMSGAYEAPSPESPKAPALLPCPFCPGEVVDNRNGTVYHEGEQHGCPLAYCSFTVEVWNMRRPTPAAPEPPVPVDLEAIKALYEKGQREFLTMSDTKRLLDAIPEVVAEVKALRSRISEATDLELCQKMAAHLYNQEWTNIEEGESLDFLAESIKGFLDHHLAEGTAKPSQDPKPSLTDAGGLPSDYGAKEAHRIAKHWLKAGDEAEPYKQALTWRNGLSAVESFLLMTTGQFPQPQHPGEAK